MLKKIENFIRENNLNFYDVAVMTPDGIESMKIQPCNSCNDSYSIAKAFIMTGIGMLWDEGLISLDDTLAKYLGDHIPEGADPKWADVTIYHTLKHLIGIDREFFDIDSYSANTFGTKDFLAFIFSRPLPHVPGGFYKYTDSAFYLLGRVIHAVSGEYADRFLMKRLLAPLDFSEVAWSMCPHGHPMGGTGLYVKAEDMVKLAWLYKNKGLYNGQRIVSEAWCDTVVERGFEMLRREECPDLIGKGGMHAQMVMYSESKPYAFAWHSFDPEGGNAAMVRFIASIL